MVKKSEATKCYVLLRAKRAYTKIEAVSDDIGKLITEAEILNSMRTPEELDMSIEYKVQKSPVRKL